MQVKDVMTTTVITANLDMPVGEIAEQLLTNHISAMPVVDAENRILGIVSEGDLMRRPENETEYAGSWWLSWMASSKDSASDYLKTHGLRAEQVMTREVVTISEEASLVEVAKILEGRHIKRLPVAREGKLIGIVSRANLLHGLVARGDQPVAAATASDDRTIREQIMAVVKQHGWPSLGRMNVVVNEGVVELWGMAESDKERQALLLAAESVQGVREVRDFMGSVPPYLYGV